MDHYSAQLMEDYCVEAKSSRNANSAFPKTAVTKSSKTQDLKADHATNKHSGNLKVELQTLRMAHESEKQLYETLKHIYGPNFKLVEASEYQNKRSNLARQYWMERGNLVIRGVVDYSSRDAGAKTHDQLTKHFATSKLESYGFHSSHCEEALIRADGHVGKALEILFEKYYRVEERGVTRSNEEGSVENEEEKALYREDSTCPASPNDLSLERRDDEKLAMESIYGDAFVEKIKNQIWLVKLKLKYLSGGEEESGQKKTAAKNEGKRETRRRDVCRLFQHGKCKFGAKCRFLHQQPEQRESRAPIMPGHDPHYTLEIRFPEECRYPYQAPYLYLYKSEPSPPQLRDLHVVSRLYEEAVELSSSGTPSLFSICSLLENDQEIKAHLETSRRAFPDRNERLFPETNGPSGASSRSRSHNLMGSTSRENRSKPDWPAVVARDEQIRDKFFTKQSAPGYRRMKEIRRRLPAWRMMDEIVNRVEENQVTIISGETGCGKSTQVPQFLLDNWLLKRTKEGEEHAEIVCTQPRRISAIGVAERIAAERDERVGDTVGYQIRLESKMSSYTRLALCTTGILLQRFASDPSLDNVTHVIVDEVHERSAESDFLLMLLRELAPKRPDLKIILMSATLKADAFSTYFGDAPVIDIPGRTFPVEQVFLEDVYERTGYVLEENSRYARRIKGTWEKLEIELEAADAESLSSQQPKNTILDENLALPQIIGRYNGYATRTYKNLYLMDHERINNELIEKLLMWIVEGHHEYPRDGSILVFLPGLAEIASLRDCLSDNKALSPRNGRFLIIPLHSSLSSEEQSLVFKKPKDCVRKIVLSTNIAETSVTIDDCVFVIDTGKMKETRFNSNQNMASLETCWVSRANAMQRKGRAGRVMPGVSFHLYTSHRFTHHFLAQPVPEILRIPLEPLLLRIRIMHAGQKIDLHNVLERVLEPPSPQSVTDALKRLQDVGAFDSDCALTALGHHLGALPVDVRIGKLILYGAIFCCVDSALTIAACLSHKSPFVSPFDKRAEVDAKRKEFRTAQSDQLTVLRAYKKWLDYCGRSSYAGQVFASENYLSTRTLHSLADIKHQLLELLVSIGFVSLDMPRRQSGVDRVNEITGRELNANNENWRLLQGLLCAALYPNVVKILTPEKSFQVQSGGAVPRQPRPEELRFQTRHDGYVNLHPSSVNFGLGHFPSPYLVYQEKVKTSKIFIREVSSVSMLPLVLFSGYGLNVEQHNGTFVVSLADGWIMLAVESHTVAQLLQRMQIELVKILEQKMQDPLLNLLSHVNGKRIIKTIIGVLERD